MQPLARRILSGAALALALGCHDPETGKKLDQLTGKVESLERKIDQLAQKSAAPAAPRLPSPEPSAVYAVDITDDPVMGPKDAKVTVVEAAEFA